MKIAEQIAMGWQLVTFWKWRDEAGEKLGIPSFRERKEGKSKERIEAIELLERSVALKEVAIAIMLFAALGFFSGYAGNPFALAILLLIAAVLFWCARRIGIISIQSIVDLVKQEKKLADDAKQCDTSH